MHIIRNIRLFFVLLLLISYCSASDSETSIKDSLYERAKSWLNFNSSENSSTNPKKKKKIIAEKEFSFSWVVNFLPFMLTMYFLLPSKFKLIILFDLLILLVTFNGNGSFISVV